MLLKVELNPIFSNFLSPTSEFLLPNSHFRILLPNSYFPLVFLDFGYNNGLGLAHRSTRKASQAILRPHRYRLMGHLKDLGRAHQHALFTRITPVRIDIDQINLVISEYFTH